jgi:polyisoprenyl-phosphate glycosyltransferase
MAEQPANADSTCPALSVVFSFRNEEAVLPELIRRLHASLDPLDLPYEIIFVNDTSTDRSLDILREHMETDSTLRVVNMANRFGVTPCFIAGMGYAQGDAVVTLDCDLQDPPELIAEMVAHWREGADVVYATRTKRAGESWFKLLVTKWAYRIINAVSDVELPVDTGMYKLMSRRAVDAVLSIKEQEPYLRGLVSWVGFKQVQVECQREERYAGKPHFSLLSSGPAKEFLIGFISFSQLPIYLMLSLGAIVTVASLVGFLAMAGHHIFRESVPLTYYGLCTVVFFGGVQLLSAGTLGLYLGRVYNQSKSRPPYIVESTLGFPE